MKILVSDPITKSGLAVLTDANFDVVQLPNGSPEEKAEACKDVHGWIIRSGTKVSKYMIEGADNLQVIGRAGVGVDTHDNAWAVNTETGKMRLCYLGIVQVKVGCFDE